MFISPLWLLLFSRQMLERQTADPASRTSVPPRNGCRIGSVRDTSPSPDQGVDNGHAMLDFSWTSGVPNFWFYANQWPFKMTNVLANCRPSKEHQLEGGQYTLLYSNITMRNPVKSGFLMHKSSGDFPLPGQIYHSIMCMPLIGCLGSQLWDPYTFCAPCIHVPPCSLQIHTSLVAKAPYQTPQRSGTHMDHIWIRGQESYLIGNHRFWEASDFGLTSHLEMLLKKDQMWEFSLHWWQWCVLFFQAVIELNT